MIVFPMDIQTKLKEKQAFANVKEQSHGASRLSLLDDN